MKSFTAILSQVRNYLPQLGLNILFNLFSILFSVVSIMMLIPFLELLFGIKEARIEVPEFSLSTAYLIDYFYFHLGTFIEKKGETGALAFICVLVAVIFFLKNLFRYLALYCMAGIRNGVVRDIRNRLYTKLMSLPLGYFSKKRKGDIIARTTTDVKEVEYSILSTIEIVFKEPVTIITYMAVMIAMSPSLTIFVLVMLGLTAGVIGQVGRRLKRESRSGQDRLGIITSMLDESLSGLRIIKAFNAEKLQIERFINQNERYLVVMNRMLRRRDLSSPLTEFLAICIVSLVLWFGGRLVLEGTSLAPAEFITYMVIFSQLIPPAKSFSTAFYNIQRGLASSERIDQILNAEDKIKEAENPKPIKDFTSQIEFRSVSFAYHNYDDKLVVEDVNLTVPKGSIIALVGQSGAGKTTLVDLLVRFYDMTSGQIFIDGTDLTEYKLSDLRDVMGIVSQEAILFNDTVMNNIKFGNFSATDEEVIEAAKVANAHDFICSLQDGYQTNIGDQGNLLSGGEKQRLTIARAILKNPPILILDEATSSLDSESENLVQEAINKLMRKRTSIVIAHRLSTIQYADEIVVMQAGKIIERGNHIGLMAKDGHYRRLVELQAF